MRRQLLRECNSAGAAVEGPLRVFDEGAEAAERETVQRPADEESEHRTRQRVRHALRDALTAGRDAMQANTESPDVPANSDRPMLEEVLVGLDSVVILLENEVFRPRLSGPMRRYGGTDDEPVHHWRGCDVRIVEAPFPSYTGSSTLVVTEHGSWLAGLFKDLEKVAWPAIDFRSKYEFFGRMAEAANGWLARHPDTDRVDLLIAVAHESRNVVEDWLARVDERRHDR